MALKKNEKLLVGLGLMAGGIALVMLLGLPQYDAYSASNAEMASKQDELAAAEQRKSQLAASVALLNKNTAIPAGVQVQSYTDDNLDATIKQQVDGIVKLSTQAGNKLISLKPALAEPICRVADPPNLQEILAKNPSIAALGNDKSPLGRCTMVEAAVNAANTPAANTAAPAANAAAPAAANATTTTAPVYAPTPPILDTFGYEISIRGTYDSVQRFLMAVDQQKNLTEVSSIKLENEAANEAQRVGADPKFPLRLTFTVRLAMQKVESDAKSAIK